MRRNPEARRPTVMAAVILATVGAGLACKGGGGVPPEAGRKSFKVAVIPKGLTHEFWKSIHAGAIKASRDLKAEGVEVEIIWKGPIREDDREQQVQVVEGFTSQGVSGIVLAPLDDKALVRPVEDAKRLGIPTVIIDSDLASDQIVSFVATDNFKGGELAAEEMARLLGGKGKLLLLRYQEGSASTTAREEGFITKLRAVAPGISLISSDQYAGATRDTAKRASENLLNRFGNDLSGIFCPNESSAAGMLLALQDISKAGTVPFIGFDSSQAFIDAMKSGQMQGTVLQNPFKMGALGVLSQSKLICTAVGAKAWVGVNARRNVWLPPAPIVTAASGKVTLRDPR
jgi:ribose transport system substrate-binding protein